ncbi:MAG TPA: Hsp20/alpha crystallin family protein [Terriglobia bacterium]|jgi:HSP20 family protein
MYFEFQAQARQGATWSPIVDVCERPGEIVIYVEMPGVHRSDVQLAWNDGVLIISGTKRQQGADENVAAYLCVERAYGHFRREISIKIPVDQKSAKAQLKDGLLKIHLPKRAEAEITIIPIG